MIHPATSLEQSSGQESSRPDEVLIAEDDPISRRVLEKLVAGNGIIALPPWKTGWMPGASCNRKIAPQMVNSGLDDAGPGRH